MASSTFRALVAAGVAASAQTTKEWRAAMGATFQTEFERAQAAENITYAAIGVSDPTYGDQVWVFGGYDDALASRDDHFGIGSISKSFGATLYLRLAEDGVLDLAQTVGEVLSANPFQEYENYTLKELVGMRTRIPDAFNVPDGFIADMLADTSARPSLEYIIASAVADGVDEDDMYGPPGSQVRNYNAAYSTTNYLVMEFLVEEVTGRSMSDLLEDYVLTPLGLTETALPLRDSSGMLPVPAARPYAGPPCVGEFVEFGADLEKGWTLDDIFSALVVVGNGGAITSTIDDLLAWAKSGCGDSLLRPETVAERHIWHSISYPQSYGLGLTPFPYLPPIYDVPILNVPGDWYGHDGDSFGFDSTAMRSEERDAAFASVINTCGFSELNYKLIKLYNADLMARKAETESPTTETPAPTAAASASAAPTREKNSDAATGRAISLAALAALALAALLVA